jgi:hypothetical protein
MQVVFALTILMHRLIVVADLMSSTTERSAVLFFQLSSLSVSLRVSATRLNSVNFVRRFLGQLLVALRFLAATAATTSANANNDAQEQERDNTGSNQQQNACRGHTKIPSVLPTTRFIFGTEEITVEASAALLAPYATTLFGTCAARAQRVALRATVVARWCRFSRSLGVRSLSLRCRCNWWC